MSIRPFCLLIAALVWTGLTAAGSCAAPSPQPGEFQERDKWVNERLVDGNPPISFVYDGKSSADLLAKWPKRTATKKLDGGRIERTWTWTDPKTGLEVRCISVEYADFPVVEWTGYLRNTGATKTPLLQAVQAIDVGMNRAKQGEFVLRGVAGDDCSPNSYQPYECVLGPNASKTIAPPAGRPTEVAFPYFNLAAPGGGLIMAVGWPGQWSATFARDAATGLRVTAGQQLTHLCLQPGEEIRTPLIALLFWKGSDVDRSQNIWRRWMLACNMPRPNGKPLLPQYCFCSGGFFEGLKVNEASEKQFFDALTKEGVKLDYWWMDAGWYPCNSWAETGTWEVDPQRFPRGIKAVSDYVHAKNTKLIVWFEPERVTGGSWLAKNHPEWLLGGTLLNLGNLTARKWLTDHVDRLLSEQGIDLYRQDFNMSPLAYWRNNDAPDRQGITENLHVQGYLAYWDALQQRHPGMLIDSCASGGRRNDIETLRRAVPLLRSDYQAFDGNPAYALGNQCHTFGLSKWIPYYGQGVYYTSQNYVYCVRSHICPSFCVCVDVRKGGIDWDLYRRLVAQWRQVADCLLGDYYPLTPYSLTDDCWMAWQFDRPEQGDGVVQVFRRMESIYESARLKLRGLDPAAQYEVTDIDAGKPKTFSGQELLNQGLSVEIGQQPGSALIKYRKL
ncbi:MAG: alpha-galactosidase [Thermoguttaceae bacterium]